MKININDVQIRETTNSDFNDIIEVEEEAFNRNDVVELTVDLLSDETAEPILSLLAFYEDEAVGHVIFSKAEIEGDTKDSSAYILAPLAIKPDYQKQGIGGLLIRKGLEILRSKGVKILFVLGHENYYPRHGFQNNAQGIGYLPPHPDPVPAEYAKYWMVQFLTDEEVSIGRVICAETMDKPKYWKDE